jgi:hypothetical protein
MNKSSKSSSSLIIGINIHSGNKLKDNIIPLNNWDIIINIIKKPDIADAKWYFKVNIWKLKTNVRNDNVI